MAIAAAPADLRAGADAGGPANGLVVRQRAVADGEDCVAEESDVGDGAAGAEAAGEAAARAADGLIVVEQAVADGEGAGIIHDGPAEAGAGEGGAGAGRAADGLVVEEGAVADGGRGRRVRGPDRHDGSAQPGAAGAARVAVRAEGLVVDEGGVADAEGSRVEDAAAERVDVGAHARKADDHVVGHDGVGEGQGAGVQDAAPPQEAVPVGDGQIVDAHRRAAADVKDPAGVAAADGQPAGTRAVDPQVVRDAQLTARQGDRAPQPVGEGDDVGTGVGVGGRDRRPQRVEAAVGEVVRP